MELQVVPNDDNLTLVALSGRLDTHGVDVIETKLTSVVVPARRHTVLDLSDVELLTSLGVRMLITLAKTLDRSGARLVLVAPQELVREALKHSAIDEIIPVCEDRAAADALLAG